MTLPTIVKTWTISANNRITYVSLNDVGARFLFGIKNFLVSTMSYTVKYTCDGTTGPTSGSDHTDRWASSANCTTQGSGTGNAQSFAVLTDANGCDILFTYQGVTGDNIKMSYSPSGVFTPAGTSNQQPTATDEVIFIPNNNDFLAVPSSGDRVWHAQASTDKKAFRVFVYRASTMAGCAGLEIITRESTINSSIVWSPSVVGWGTFNSTTVLQAGCALGTGTAVGASGQARVNAVLASIGGCGETMNGTAFFSTAVPELQAASPIVPVGFATATVGVAGKLGMRIDAWTVFANGIAQGDTFGALGFVYFGTLVLPWDGSSTPVIS